jgi:hypothetical protein
MRCYFDPSATPVLGNYLSVVYFPLGQFRGKLADNLAFIRKEVGMRRKSGLGVEGLLPLYVLGKKKQDQRIRLITKSIRTIDTCMFSSMGNFKMREPFFGSMVTNAYAIPQTVMYPCFNITWSQFEHREINFGATSVSLNGGVDFGSLLAELSKIVLTVG